MYEMNLKSEQDQNSIIIKFFNRLKSIQRARKLFTQT